MHPHAVVGQNFVWLVFAPEWPSSARQLASFIVLFFFVVSAHSSLDQSVLAVLTNSWKGSTLVRHVVEDAGLVPASEQAPVAPVAGTYALDSLEAVVSADRIVERETDPVTGAALERRYPFSPDATLMSWRSDFPRAGVARIGWTAVPRVSGGAAGAAAGPAR